MKPCVCGLPGWKELQPFSPEVCDVGARLGCAPLEQGVLWIDPAVGERLRRAAAAPREVLGVLFGRAFQDRVSGRYATLVSQVALLRGAPSSAVHVCADAESWKEVWPTFAEAQAVGWFHSHPGHGVFFSETDRETQRRHFAAGWQVGVVVDAQQGQWGAFAGVECEPIAISERILPDLNCEDHREFPLRVEH